MSDTEQMVADYAWVKALIARRTDLALMRHRVKEIDGHVAVEVDGAHYEARAWRAAIDGRIYPSHIDVHGIRHQLVIGSRVSVHVVQHPGARGDL
ncbi:hypothetical protein [Kribbella deserti]|uniref:Uncharacterized protein n=1 Tax=Kribbella deserti TaxID=1926257 RepID=A0ABV6QN11_9ACTN